jgi:hypothetical protein
MHVSLCTWGAHYSHHVTYELQIFVQNKSDVLFSTNTHYNFQVFTFSRHNHVTSKCNDLDLANNENNEIKFSPNNMIYCIHIISQAKKRDLQQQSLHICFPS